MASNLRYSLELKADRMNMIATHLGSEAVFEGYDGIQPANPNTAITTQKLLFSQVCSVEFANETSTAVLTVNAIADGTGTAAAGANGTTCTWGRFRKSSEPIGGFGVVDVSVGATASDINMSPDPLIKTGQTVQMVSLTFTSGN